VHDRLQNPLAANESLRGSRSAAIAQAKAFGCKIIVLDDALSPDKQVSHMQQLLAQGAQAIIFYPLDPKATLPVLAQAKSKGVPVIAIDATFGNPKLAVAPGIVTQVWQGRDIMAFLQVGGAQGPNPQAKVGLVGIGAGAGAPSTSTSARPSARRPGDRARDAGQSDRRRTGGEKAGNGLIQRYSDMDSVIGYNDLSALGTVIAARGAGRKLVAIGLNGTSDGIAGVQRSPLAATVQGARLISESSRSGGTTDHEAAPAASQGCRRRAAADRPRRTWTRSSTGRPSSRTSPADLSPGPRPGRGPWPRLPCQQPRYSSADGVHKRYGGVHAPRGAHLHVRPGEVHASWVRTARESPRS
jgi:ribose transport system substrate-binding protein